jgi:hypothetical protein
MGAVALIIGVIVALIRYLVQPSFYLGHINRKYEINLLQPIDDILLTTMLKSTLLQLNIEE